MIGKEECWNTKDSLNATIRVWNWKLRVCSGAFGKDRCTEPNLPIRRME